MGYLCVNFGLPRPLCSRFRADIRDRRQTSDAHHRIMPPPIRGMGIMKIIKNNAFLADAIVLKAHDV